MVRFDEIRKAKEKLQIMSKVEEKDTPKITKQRIRKECYQIS